MATPCNARQFVHEGRFGRTAEQRAQLVAQRSPLGAQQRFIGERYLVAAQEEFGVAEASLFGRDARLEPQRNEESRGSCKDDRKEATGAAPFDGKGHRATPARPRRCTGRPRAGANR